VNSIKEFDWSTARSKKDLEGALRIAVPFGDGFIVRLVLVNPKLNSYDGGFDDSMISRSDGGSSISRTDEKSTLPSCTVSNKNSQDSLRRLHFRLFLLFWSTNSPFQLATLSLSTFGACGYRRIFSRDGHFGFARHTNLPATERPSVFELAVITNEPGPTSQISKVLQLHLTSTFRAK